MQKICRESEASLDYYSLFKAIMKRVPVPMSPLESLASSAVRTAHKVLLLQLCRHVKASLILHCGTTSDEQYSHHCFYLIHSIRVDFTFELQN